MKATISIERVVKLMWKHQTPTQRRHNEVELNGFLADIKKVRDGKPIVEELKGRAKPKAAAKKTTATRRGTIKGRA